MAIVPLTMAIVPLSIVYNSFHENKHEQKNEVIRLKIDVSLFASFPYQKRFISLIKGLINQIS